MMKVYIERNILQLELIRYSKTVTFTFAKRRIRPRNAYQDVSNTNHFDSVSESRPTRRMASKCIYKICKYLYDFTIASSFIIMHVHNSFTAWKLLLDSVMLNNNVSYLSQSSSFDWWQAFACISHASSGIGTQSSEVM